MAKNGHKNTHILCIEWQKLLHNPVDVYGVMLVTFASRTCVIWMCYIDFQVARAYLVCVKVVVIPRCFPT